MSVHIDLLDQYINIQCLNEDAVKGYFKLTLNIGTRRHTFRRKSCLYECRRTWLYHNLSRRNQCQGLTPDCFHENTTGKIIFQGPQDFCGNITAIEFHIADSSSRGIGQKKNVQGTIPVVSVELTIPRIVEWSIRPSNENTFKAIIVMRPTTVGLVLCFVALRCTHDTIVLCFWHVPSIAEFDIINSKLKGFQVLCHLRENTIRIINFVTDFGVIHKGCHSKSSFGKEIIDAIKNSFRRTPQIYQVVFETARSVRYDAYFHIQENSNPEGTRTNETTVLSAFCTWDGACDTEGSLDGACDGKFDDGIDDGIDEGTEEGIDDGNKDGLPEGACDGNSDGDAEGVVLGDEEGIDDGNEDGLTEGVCDGDSDGDVEGVVLGDKDGDKDGDVEGVSEGSEEGVILGEKDGTTEGDSDGDKDGSVEGVPDGAEEGARLGLDDGEIEGVPDGTPDGTEEVDGASDGVDESEGAKDIEGVPDGSFDPTRFESKVGDKDGALTANKVKATTRKVAANFDLEWIGGEVPLLVVSGRLASFSALVEQ
eukprot:scaffold1982_cov93-Amphora_coffeaeformis.AAC.64